jgi:hypothetical protein
MRTKRVAIAPEVFQAGHGHCVRLPITPGALPQHEPRLASEGEPVSTDGMTSRPGLSAVARVPGGSMARLVRCQAKGRTKWIRGRGCRAGRERPAFTACRPSASRDIGPLLTAAGVGLTPEGDRGQFQYAHSLPQGVRLVKSGPLVPVRIRRVTAFGAARGTRTPDALLRTEALCPLSYSGMGGLRRPACLVAASRARNFVPLAELRSCRLEAADQNWTFVRPRPRVPQPCAALTRSLPGRDRTYTRFEGGTFVGHEQPPFTGGCPRGLCRTGWLAGHRCPTRGEDSNLQPTPYKGAALPIELP